MGQKRLTVKGLKQWMRRTGTSIVDIDWRKLHSIGTSMVEMLKWELREDRKRAAPEERA